MDVGEAFVALASTVHAGGANTTSRSRPLHGFFFCRSYLRPEVCLSGFLIVRPSLGGNGGFRATFVLSVSCHHLLTWGFVGESTHVVE